MAKKEEIKSQKSKITVMMFQLEGTDQTLQEGIKTIGQALGVVLKPMRVIPPKINGGESEEPEVSPDVTEVDETTEEGQEVSLPQRESKPTRPRSPKVLDLNLKGSTVPLKEFIESKKVGDSDSDRYLAITFWLKENLKISEVTMDHIHTCYRFLNWQTPADASSPLRNGKQAGWYGKGDGKGGYVINHIGENRIMEMGGSK